MSGATENAKLLLQRLREDGEVEPEIAIRGAASRSAAALCSEQNEQGTGSSTARPRQVSIASRLKRPRFIPSDIHCSQLYEEAPDYYTQYVTMSIDPGLRRFNQLPRRKGRVLPEITHSTIPQEYLDAFRRDFQVNHVVRSTHLTLVVHNHRHWETLLPLTESFVCDAYIILTVAILDENNQRVVWTDNQFFVTGELGPPFICVKKSDNDVAPIINKFAMASSLFDIQDVSTVRPNDSRIVEDNLLLERSGTERNL